MSDHDYTTPEGMARLREWVAQCDHYAMAIDRAAVTALLDRIEALEAREAERKAVIDSALRDRIEALEVERYFYAAALRYIEGEDEQV